MSRAPFPEVSAEDWRRRVVDELGGESPATLGRTTPDGVDLEPLYTRAAAPEAPDAPSPGARRPILCSLLDRGSPVEVRHRLHAEFHGGAEGVWLRLDKCARSGADLETAAGAIGGGGVELHHGGDLAAAFDAADLSAGEIWLDAGANALPWAALWSVWCERAGVPPESIRVHWALDPLAALARDGTLPRDSMKLGSEMAALLRFTARHRPGSTAVGVSAEPYHEAGASMAQELGFAVATLVDYVRLLEESGLDGTEVAGQVTLRFALGTRVFQEIAKLRAVRLLWRAALAGAGVDAAPEPRIQAVSGRRALSRVEPELNLLRAAEQTFAAMCGGASAITVRGYDDITGARGETAARLARNAFLVLEHEGRLTRVGDPAAGSFYVETATRDLAESGWAIFQEVERRGGMRSCLLEGRVGTWIEAEALARAERFADGVAGITGVSEYVREGASPVSDVEGQDESRRAESAVARLEHHRAQWGRGGADAGDGRDSKAAAPTYSRDFVVEELAARARSGATLAEIGSVLGSSEGAERMEPLPARRDAARFEEKLAEEGR